MSSSKRKTTLSERLAELTSTAPSTTFDPDAPDFDDGTGAGLSRYDAHEEESEIQPSADLRIAADMKSIGQEYGGKRVSRKALAATLGLTAGDAPDPEAGSSENGSSMDYDEDDLDLDGQPGTGGVASLNLDDVSSSSEEDDEDEDEDDHHGTGGGDGKQANVFAGVRDEGGVDAMVQEQIVQLDRQDEKARKGRGAAGLSELNRAREALRQRQWWDSLLEVRILLQRLMNAANRLPGPNELPLFLEGEEELTSLAEEGASAAQGLEEHLCATRRSHMACWGVVDDRSRNNVDGGDVSENTDNSGTKVAEASNGRFLFAGKGENDKESTAEADHKLCMNWWEKVLGRWHQRTQLVDPALQRKFKVVNQGPWAQVTASLADRGRANRRSFMAESEICTLQHPIAYLVRAMVHKGVTVELEPQPVVDMYGAGAVQTNDFIGRKLAKRLKTNHTDGAPAENAAVIGEETRTVEVLGRERRKEGEPVDLEVIDDRELYQHLLKEFMDSSGGVAGNGYGALAGVPVRRKSRKKTVDRRASKGRKIKYVTHPKMQNFMFPQEYAPAPMEPSEFFSSLFGGAAARQ